jgi:hypothetical protein
MERDERVYLDGPCLKMVRHGQAADINPNDQIINVEDHAQDLCSRLCSSLSFPSSSMIPSDGGTGGAGWHWLHWLALAGS